MGRQKNVLLLCTANSARSQMAEVWLRKYGGDHFEVHSAGLEPSVINPLTLQVMEEKGIDMSSHTSKGVGEYLGKKHFTYMITVCSSAEDKCPTAFLGELHRLYWPSDDPATVQGSDEEKLAKFREVREGIEAKVKRWLSLPEDEMPKYTVAKMS